MSSILITGGAGFIFSNFIHYMIKKHPDYKLVNLDKLTYAANLGNLNDVEKNNNYKFYKGDICDRRLVEKIVKKEKIDAIINGAAETHVDRSIADAGSFVRTDVFGVFTLLEIVRKFGIGKMIQVSTDEIYGSIEKGSFRETDKLNPGNPYSASKAAGDLLALSYFNTYNAPVMITRSTNNYGPFHYPEKLIPKAIVYALLGRRIPVYGRGSDVRDWLFVEDNCEAIDMVLQKGKEGEVYNIAGKQEMKNIEVVNAILEKTGRDESLIDFVKDRPGHDLRYSLDTDKINKLGWKPRTKFGEGIGKTIVWFRENEQWWRRIAEKREIDFHQNF